jgi:membrane fusion protein (multidrug efflux system)
MTISVPRTLPLATLLRLGAAATLGVLLAGCAKTEPPPPPPPEVRVVAVESRPISNVIEVPGRLQAVRTADVRARVDGIVERRVYAEGSDVRAGQALFAIDPLPLRARLGAAEAALARAEATAANAAQDVKRYDGLVGKQAISQQEYDAAVARLRTAEADVAAARAQVQTARLNLGYATVTAPISGRAGRAAVTEGALVSAGAGTLLTRIEQLDPLFVNFSQSNAELLAVRQAMARGEGKGRVSVRLVLDYGSTYDRVGRLDFLDLSIDEATGTAALRAEMPNPDRLLLPGQFVRVRIELGEPVEGLAVPQRAVTVGASGKSVMVVGADGKAERREVTLGELQGDAWIVLSGLTEGERVITDGIQKVQPGQPVRLAAEQTGAASGELSATKTDSTGKAAS